LGTPALCSLPRRKFIHHHYIFLWSGSVAVGFYGRQIRRAEGVLMHPAAYGFPRRPFTGYWVNRDAPYLLRCLKTH
jgi:hypothetical protein